MRKAIIGGTGVYSLSGQFPDSVMEERTVRTEYGDVDVTIMKTPDGEIVFLARHGRGHAVPPHLINYRANMKALAILGVDEVLATCAVGSMRERFGVGDVVLLKDFIDFTKARPQTFFDGSDGAVRHVVMDSPYCQRLSDLVAGLAPSAGVDIKGRAIYVCTEGPRFETAAEIRMYAALGGDVVGMTNVPECVLAKELGMCYAAVGIISNWCTGISFQMASGGSDAAGNDKTGGGIALHDIEAAMAANKDKVTALFVRALLGSGSDSTSGGGTASVGDKTIDGETAGDAAAGGSDSLGGSGHGKNCSCASSVISL